MLDNNSAANFRDTIPLYLNKMAYQI